MTICFVCAGLTGAYASPENEESIPRRAWEEARAKHRGEGPPLLIVHPSNGETVAAEMVRFGGCTEPGSEVTVNGTAAHVYSTGAFVGMERLRPGKNPIVFRSTLRGKSTTMEMHVLRPEPPKALPKTSLKIETTRSFSPNSDVEMLEGDVLRVRCQGSPGAKAWFRIGWGRKRHEMRELSPEKDGVPIAGIYEGVYVIEPDVHYVKAAITVTLEAIISGRRQSVSARAKGLLTTDPKHVRRFAFATVADSGLYTDLSTASRWTSVPTGAQLELDGRLGVFHRVRLGTTQHGWVYSRNLRMAEKKEIVPPPRFHEAILQEDALTGDAVLSVFLGDPGERIDIPSLPFRVETSSASSTITLTIWGVENEPAEETADSKDAPIPSGALRILGAGDMHWESSATSLVRSVRRLPSDAETCVLEVGLHTRHVWGYDATLEGGALKLWLKPPARILDEPGRPLTGLRIFLDAGHGGRDAGAIGPGGLYESDANLAITRRLGALLERAGALVETTRTDDRAVSLEERIERVSRSGADFFLSVHNNSVPLSRNPLGISGPFFFFYHGHGFLPARHLYNALTRETGFPRQPVVRVNPHFFRPMRLCPQMPCVLAEVVFLSNPEDESLLLQSAFLDNVAMGLYKGIADFFERPAFPLAVAAPQTENEKAVLENIEIADPSHEIAPMEEDVYPMKKAGVGKVPITSRPKTKASSSKQ